MERCSKGAPRPLRKRPLGGTRRRTTERPARERLLAPVACQQWNLLSSTVDADTTWTPHAPNGADSWRSDAISGYFAAGTWSWNLSAHSNATGTSAPAPQA